MVIGECLGHQCKNCGKVFPLEPKIGGWDLLSNCCAWDFDPFGVEKDEGVYQERCLKCGKLCEPLYIGKNDILNIRRLTEFEPKTEDTGECICLEDNKLTQALCPVHNPKTEVKTQQGWEDRLEKRFGDKDMGEIPLWELKDWFRGEIETSKKELIEKIAKQADKARNTYGVGQIKGINYLEYLLLEELK